MSKKLVWILAGGAVLALGGVAIWMWRRRSKAPAKFDEQPPAPEPDDEPLPKTETTAPPSTSWEQFDLRAHVTTQASNAPTSEAEEQPLPSVLEDRPAEQQPPPPKPVELVTHEPPPVLIPKHRRKRYPVGPGDLIELRPDQVPPDASWATSRPDVEVRVVEQTDSRAVVALDGPAGEVNVALLHDGPKGPRPITSWKFEIIDKVA